jgi:hypothetical protein
MKPEEQAFLETLPAGPSRESWRRSFEAVSFRPARDAPTVADPRVWTPPANPPMMPDPTSYPYHDAPLAYPYPIREPRPLTWAQYWQLFSRALVADPVVEATNPYRIRLELGTWVPPYNPHPGNPLPGGFVYAWRTCAQWIEHLKTSDLLAAGSYIF